MNKYKVRVGSVAYMIKASQPETAVFRAIKSARTRKLVRFKTLDYSVNIDVTLIEKNTKRD